MTIGMGIAIAASLMISAGMGSESANAASGAAVRADGAAVATSKAEEKICKRLVTSGTRMTTRVCLTKLEWKKIEQDS